MVNYNTDPDRRDNKAIHGHVEHWIEQRRIEEHFGRVQEEKHEGELIEL